MAHHRDPSEEIEIPQGADAMTATMARILNQQVAINRQLMQNKGSSLPVQLPYFHGRENENVQTWLFQVDQVFKAKKIEPRQSIYYVVACLKEAALHWYQNQVERAHDEDAFDNLNDFAQAIREAFQPPHYQQILRRQLRGLRQKDSVQKYVYEFRNLIGQIEGMGELDQVMHFIDGLKQATKVEVNYKSPNTLEEAIHAAIAYDTARFGPARVYLPNTQGYQGARTKPHHHRDDGGVRPMELDQAQGNRAGGQPNRGPRNQRTPAELETLRREGKCFHCREQGHLSRNCPRKNRPNRNQAPAQAAMLESNPPAGKEELSTGERKSLNKHQSKTTREENTFNSTSPTISQAPLDYWTPEELYWDNPGVVIPSGERRDKDFEATMKSSHTHVTPTAWATWESTPSVGIGNFWPQDALEANPWSWDVEEVSTFKKTTTMDLEVGETIPTKSKKAETKKPSPTAPKVKKTAKKYLDMGT